MSAIVVPLAKLSPVALDGVIDDFITREGTDYGAEEYSLDTKRMQVRRQLERGEAVVTFDPETESVTLVLARDL